MTLARVFHLSTLLWPFILVPILISCGEPAINGDEPGPAPITVEEALTVAEGETVVVSGALLSVGGETRLCSALAESYPPQCGGESLVLLDLDPEDIVGLSRPDSPELGDVLWSDFALTVRGVREGTNLRVTEILQAVTSVSKGDIRVRIAYAPSSLREGNGMTWLLDVTNELSLPLVLTFNSSQTGEVVLRSESGAEVYRWSANKLFAQAVRDIVIAPGDTWGFTLGDVLRLEPGIYDLTAWVTADSPAMPQVETAVTVEPAP